MLYDLWSSSEPIVQASSPHLRIKSAEGLHQEGGPAHVENRSGAALLPLTDPVVEAQQVCKAFRVLEGGESRSLLGLVLRRVRNKLKREQKMKWKTMSIHFDPRRSD